MALETSYQNTDVVLTQRLTGGQKRLVIYFKFLTWMAVSLYLITVSLGMFLLLTVLTLAAYFIIAQWVQFRPQILLNREKRVVELRHSIWFWKSRVVPPREIQHIAVSLETRPTGRGGEDRLYRPQIILKNPRNPSKRETIGCFALDDIIEAHYIAQLMAAFAQVRAYDIKGNVLPMLRNYIPTKYLAGRAPEPVSAPMPSGKAKARATA